MRFALDQFPRIDAARCTGCGRCWTLCPDGAIAPCAIGLEALLRAAAHRKAQAGRVVKRDPTASHKFYQELKAALEEFLSALQPKTLYEEPLRKAFNQWKQNASPSEEDERSYKAEVQAMIKGLADLPASITKIFYCDSQERELLVLAVDPDTCQRCGGCARVCPASAIEMGEQTPMVIDRLKRHWKAFERLPDTRDETVERAAALPEVGALPALLMSRRYRQSFVAGAGGEPGSGERLAVRLIVAGVAYESRRRFYACAEEINELPRKRRAAVADCLSEAVAIENLGVARFEPKSPSDRATNQGGMISRLYNLGERVTTDMRHLAALIESLEQAERLGQQLGRGLKSEVGPRYRLVLAGPSLSRWAGSIAASPYAVSLDVDPNDDGCTLAATIARQLLKTRADEYGIRRKEETSPPRSERAEANAFTPREMSTEYLALCPTVVLICGPELLSETGLESLNQLLSAGLPVKIFQLDSAASLSYRAESDFGGDHGLIRFADRRAFIASSSLAYPAHLFGAIRAALAFPGPALIQLYTPSPRQHGFLQSDTVERAALATASRVRPLLQHHPTAEDGRGVLSLEDNPAPETPWGEDARKQAFTPAHWAVGEARFSGQFTELIPKADAVAVELWAFMPPAEQSNKTPFITGTDGVPKAVSAELAAFVVEHANHWANLRKQTTTATHSADLPCADTPGEPLQKPQGDVKT